MGRRAGVLVAALVLGAARDAHAFCRTMACPLPPDFSPSPGQCVPPNFDDWCASQSPPDLPLVVWWRNACVGYDIQENASRQVPYGVADEMFAAAFAKWTSIECAGGGASDGSERVSIDVRDLGPVACDLVQYDDDGPNQHVIIFHDDVWPHDDANNTLGLTTITYDPQTGEIYDADMEINSTVPLSLTDPIPADGYDFQSIITHETGHFFGMAHTGDAYATMFAHYQLGSTTMRNLADDDIQGMCDMYLPNGQRVVDPSITVGQTGRIPEDACDPTPRHGFTTQCMQPPSKSTCAATDARAGGAEETLGLCGMVALVGMVRSRRRRREAAIARM